MIQPAGIINSVANVSHMDSVRPASEASLAREAVPTVLCLLAAMVPLVFAVRLFEPYIGAKEILVQAGTATAALIWLWTARKDSWSLPRTSAWIPLLTLALIGAISLWWSTAPAISFEKARYLVTYILLFALTLWAMQRAGARRALASALVLAGTIEAVYVLLQHLVGDPIFAAAELSGKWQTFGTLGNPNWTGEFLAVAALVSLGRLVEARRTSLKYTGPLTMAALILMVLALASTLARGAWLAFIVGLAAFALAGRFGSVILRFKSNIVPLAATAVAAVVVVGLPLLSSPGAVGHLVNLKSIRGRLLMWVVSLDMIWDAPWFGHGLGTFGLQFPNYQAVVLSQPWAAAFISNASFTSYAHNDYLQLWAELGVFAFAAFCTLVWMLLKRGRALSNDPVALGCWAAVLSLLVNAGVAFPLHLPTTLMLFVVLVAVVEATAVKEVVVRKNIPLFKRIAIALPISALCISAYWLSYDRAIADAALWQADALVENGWLNEAESDIRKAVKHAPTNLDGQIMLGRLQVERGQYARGLSTLDEAQKLGPDERIFDLKATALNASRQRPAAIAALTELIRLRPDLQWPRERVAALSLNADGNKENIR